MYGLGKGAELAKPPRSGRINRGPRTFDSTLRAEPGYLPLRAAPELSAVHYIQLLTRLVMGLSAAGCVRPVTARASACACALFLRLINAISLKLRLRQYISYEEPSVPSAPPGDREHTMSGT